MNILRKFMYGTCVEGWVQVFARPTSQHNDRASRPKCVVMWASMRLRTWDPVWSGKSQPPCTPRLRLHRLTSIDLVLRTWDPCELALKATSHMILRARDHYYTSSILIGGKGGAGPSSLHTHSRDQRSKWMQNGYNVYMDSFMALNGSRFMIIWIIFKNHLLKINLTQNQETMALWALTTVGFYLGEFTGKNRRTTSDKK